MVAGELVSGNGFQEGQQHHRREGGSQEERGGQAELQAAARATQGLAAQHTENDAAVHHAVHHIINYILTRLKVSIRETEAEAQARWKEALQSRQKFLYYPALVLPAVRHEDVKKEPLSFTPLTPPTLEPNPEQGLQEGDP